MDHLLLAPRPATILAPSFRGWARDGHESLDPASPRSSLRPFRLRSTRPAGALDLRPLPPAPLSYSRSSLRKVWPAVILTSQATSTRSTRSRSAEVLPLRSSPPPR